MRQILPFFLLFFAASGRIPIGIAASSIEEASECNDDVPILRPKEIIEATNENFETLLYNNEILCVAFYSSEIHPIWLKFRATYEKLVGNFSTFEKKIGFAAVDLEKEHALGVKTAATGPVSLKLFHRVLPSKRSYTLYARHMPLSVNITSEYLSDLLKGFANNCTGDAYLDDLSRSFIEAYSARNFTGAQAHFEAARVHAKENGVEFDTKVRRDIAKPLFKFQLESDLVNYEEIQNAREESGVSRLEAPAVFPEESKRRIEELYLETMQQVKAHGVKYLSRQYNSFIKKFSQTYVIEDNGRVVTLEETAEMLRVHHVLKLFLTSLVGEDFFISKDVPKPKIDQPETPISTTKQVHAALKKAFKPSDLI